MKVRDVKDLMNVYFKMKVEVRKLNGDVKDCKSYEDYKSFILDNSIDNYELINRLAIDMFDNHIVIWCK